MISLDAWGRLCAQAVAVWPHNHLDPETVQAYYDAGRLAAYDDNDVLAALATASRTHRHWPSLADLLTLIRDASTTRLREQQRQLPAADDPDRRGPVMTFSQYLAADCPGLSDRYGRPVTATEARSIVAGWTEPSAA